MQNWVAEADLKVVLWVYCKKLRREDLKEDQIVYIELFGAAFHFAEGAEKPFL